jgi:prevent-host-death family protein
MRTIAVSDLRANLMNILKDIEHGTSIDITSRGKVIAKLVPPENSQITAQKKLAELAKTAVINDIISPIDEQWEAMK